MAPLPRSDAPPPAAFRSTRNPGASSPAAQRLGRRVENVLLDAAAVVVAWCALLLAETVALGFLWRDAFSGIWEIVLTRHIVVPIALLGLAPLAPVIAAGWRAAASAAAGETAPARALAVCGVVLAGALAIGVSGGRHFASWAVRAPFVVAIAALGGLGAAWVVPRVTTLARWPTLLATLGLVVTMTTWLADGYVLPRLYPAFHLAMLGGALVGSGVIGIAFRVGSSPTRTARGLAVVVGLVVVASTAWIPHALQALDRATNLRIALVEHAPLLGRAVAVTTRLRRLGDEHVSPEETGAAGSNPKDPSLIAPGEVARALDWTQTDVILVSVDALRADHVSSYGYSRPTTPNIDGLAREGTLFESAYCPTPHTSYSLTSMLTGKYLRPLLALGLGEDSETWAQALRRYGWRTAGFYPPAVFFIDEASFGRFEREQLGFEYAKVEFATAAAREKQIDEYLQGAAPEIPLFLWVHLFEPHEPYVVHPEHVFSGGPSPDVDAYDSEVAAADDGIGAIVRAVRAHRRRAVVMVTADHGEEFGEHGGHYHGTTVYEEQVRVPLVVAGLGVQKGNRVATVVQTIDLLPTVISALGMPRPARLRGRDLGPMLAGAAGGADAGFAFVETDDYDLVASGDERLVCTRRAAACALYRPHQDPLERRDVGADEPQRLAALRTMLRGVVRDHGRYEASGSAAWPEALRRGMQGEGDASFEVASLLDDAGVAIRRKAAEVCFGLHAQATIPALKRALARDEDDEVRRWCALALARMGEPVSPLVDALLKDPSRDWRRRAALTLGERGEERACDVIGTWWADTLPPAGPRADGESPRLALDLAHARELLAATAAARCRNTVPALVRALDDVRVRPYVADALGAIGDSRARLPLLALFADEPYITARPHEARALLALGVRSWLGGSTPAPEVEATLEPPTRAGALRLVVLLSDADAALEGVVDGAPVAATPLGSEVRSLELPARSRQRVEVHFRATIGGVVAIWLIPST